MIQSFRSLTIGDVSSWYVLFGFEIAYFLQLVEYSTKSTDSLSKSTNQRTGFCRVLKGQQAVEFHPMT